jgi:hypothetical protein
VDESDGNPRVAAHRARTPGGRTAGKAQRATLAPPRIRSRSSEGIGLRQGVATGQERILHDRTGTTDENMTNNEEENSFLFNQRKNNVCESSI